MSRRQLQNLSILDLRPTQFVLGVKEIESKVKKMTDFSAAALREYCDDHVIPVVLGPSRQTFMIDHHHFARACWEVKTDLYSVKVVKDLSSLENGKFWNKMVKEGWVHLHDQFGLGPHSPYDLPVDVRCMADDPYRSLAWAVRERGGFRKRDDIPFFEFQWASFYRRNLSWPLHSKSDFKEAIKQAVRLSRSKEASHLPGYRSR